MATATTADEKSVDAIDLLTEDHKEVKERFKYFSELKGAGPTEARIAAAEDICRRLAIHTAIKEELFYPAARQAINDDELVNEAEIEHAVARDLIKQLLPAEKDDTHFCAKVAVLWEYTKHNMNEEENEMFPRVKQSKTDLSALGQQLVERRRELLEKVRTPEEVLAFASL